MGELEVPVVLLTPCPSCNGPGYLEFLDVQNAVMLEACRSCGHRWETPFGKVAQDAAAAEKSAQTIGANSTRTSLAERLLAARQ